MTTEPKLLTEAEARKLRNLSRDKYVAELRERGLIAKPDPLVEVIRECDEGTWETKAEYAERLRKALAKRGGKIVWNAER